LSSKQLFLILAFEVKRTALLLISTKNDISVIRYFNRCKLRFVITWVYFIVDKMFVIDFCQMFPWHSFESLVITDSALSTINKILGINVTRQGMFTNWSWLFITSVLCNNVVNLTRSYGSIFPSLRVALVIQL